MSYHVVPVDDVIQHIEDPECICDPTLLPDKPIWVHHSLDGREQREVQRFVESETA